MIAKFLLFVTLLAVANCQCEFHANECSKLNTQCFNSTDKCWLFSTIANAWNTSRKYCQSIANRSDLITFDSLREISDFSAAFKLLFPHDNSMEFSIGGKFLLHSSHQLDNWYWVNGQSISFPNPWAHNYIDKDQCGSLKDGRITPVGCKARWGLASCVISQLSCDKVPSCQRNKESSEVENAVVECRDYRLNNGCLIVPTEIAAFSWDDSHDYCRSINGQMPVVKNRDELDHFEQLIGSIMGAYHKDTVYNIGLRKQRDGLWHWSDNSFLKYPPWEPGHAYDSKKLCLSVVASKESQPFLKSYECLKPKFAACEMGKSQATAIESEFIVLMFILLPLIFELF